MYVAVDMGGTNTRVAVFESPLSIEFTAAARFPTEPCYEQQVRRIVDVVQSIPDARGIGFAIGAQMTPDGLAVDVSYTTMADFAGKPIVQAVSEQTGLPIQAANDNVCANLAETTHGVLAPYERAAYLTVSTGTGAGVRMGRLDVGAFLYLAQVGHHMIFPGGERCVCGQIGCVQTITGGQSIAHHYGVSAAQLDDEAAWHQLTETIAIAIVNLARIARVEAVCVGGGIGCNATYFHDHLADSVQDKSPQMPIAVRFPALGEEAPLIGAVALLRQDLRKTIFH